MRASFRLLQEKYPHIVPLGCLAHLLHLLCGDIVNSSSIKTKIADVIQVTKTIKNSHVLKATFDQIGREKDVTVALKLPALTRWGSYLDCLKSVVTNKSVIQTLAVTEGVIITLEIKKKILDDNFWNHIQNMMSLLEPIINLLIKVQSNEPQIHIVYRELTKLESTLMDIINVINFEEFEKDNIIKKLVDRKKFALGDIHFAADLLNPSTQGCDLNPTQLLDAMTFIYNMGKHSHINEIKLRSELVNFRDKEDIWAKTILWDGHDSMPPLLWWRGLRGTCELADIAIRILSAPITSAATERTFSAFSWLHCKKRNRLTTTNAAKLTYLTYNDKLLNTYKSNTNQNITDTDKNEESDDEMDEDEQLSTIEDISSDESVLI
nr:uncharacterized protein LOC111418143 [Onthophagus taurus]